MEIPIFLLRFLPWKHLKPVHFRVHTYAFTCEEGKLANSSMEENAKALATILPGSKFWTGS